nr:MAG TPA: hypothetical protein [Caudoviricetes sp.]DAH44976.1 MAG TPA: hypothetical protein [Caudoviricetes sp.]
MFYSAKIIVIIVPKTRKLKYTLSSFPEVTLSICILFFLKSHDWAII